MVDDSGYLDEVFCSIQGEGEYLGYRQIFVRTAGCGRGCVYCDTRGASEVSGSYSVFFEQGSEQFDNPAEPGRVARLITDRLLHRYRPVHSVSLTGGEPLEQPEFVLSLAGELKRSDLPIYLETSGLDYEAVRQLKPVLDIVSLDIKQPALCGGSGEFFSIYERVLRELRGIELSCKIVLCGGFSMEEFTESVITVSRVDRSIPLVIQPASPPEMRGRYRVPEISSLMDCYTLASDHLNTVRIIPQCHKLLGIR